MTKNECWLTSLSSNLPDLFERLPFPIAIMNDDGQVAFANREFKEVFPADCPASRSLPVEVEAPGHGVYELRTIPLDGLKAIVGRDISEAVESRRQLAKMEKFVSFGQIASGVTNELNTLLDNGDVQRASDIVHRFLEPVDGTPKSLAACNLNSLVESVLQMRTSTYASRNIRITTELHDDLPAVLIDLSQIQQVLLCLLLHAELNSGNIHIRSIAQDNRVRILISSSGESKTCGQVQAGLNLDFSAEIVSRYGGRLCTWRNGEVGSTIMLELPATPANEDTAEHRASTPHLSRTTMSSPADVNVVAG